MATPNWKTPPGAGGGPGIRYRGVFVKWADVGYTVEGIVTYADLEVGATTTTGEPQGMVQIYDPSVGDQGPGNHGFYRRIDLGKKALLSVVERCLKSGLQPGWHLRLTYVESVKNQVAGLHPWKKFKAEVAEPTISAEEIASLVAGGIRPDEEGGNGASAPAEAQPAAPAPAAQAAPAAPAPAAATAAPAFNEAAAAGAESVF